MAVAALTGRGHLLPRPVTQLGRAKVVESSWFVQHQPAGEAGELRLIKQLDLYRDDAEREFVQKRLAVITAELRSHWHRRVA